MNEISDARCAGLLLGVWASIAILFFTSLFRPSQPPSPTPAKSRQEDQQHGKREANVTAQKNEPAQSDTSARTQPSRIIGGPKNGNQRSGRDQDSATDWNKWVAIFTFALALTAAIQVWVYYRQTGYMERGLKQTERAANAASKSADVAEQALHVAERAYFNLDDLRMLRFSQNDAIDVAFDLTNTGRTPANVTKTTARLYISDSEPGKAEAIEHDPTAVGRVSSGDQLTARIEFAAPLSEDQYTRISDKQQPTLTLWIAVVVEYADAFGHPQSDEFWRRYRPHVGGFAKYAPSQRTMAKEEGVEGKHNEDERSDEQQPPEANPTPTPAVVNPPNRPVDNGDGNGGNQGNQPRPRRTINWDRWFAGALIFFTAVQGLVGYWQWDATSKQWNAMLDQIEQMRFDARPWLYLQASVEETAPGHLFIKFDLHNDGRSPAFLKRWKLSSFAITPPLDSKKQLFKHEQGGEWIEANNIIRPTGTSLLPLPKPLFVDEQITAEMRSGKSQFIAFLTITYTDSSENLDGESQFCWLYDPTFDDMTGYPKHNHMK